MISNDLDPWRGYKSPCYMCEHRKSRCHDNCSEYIKYKKFLRDIADKQSQNAMTAATARRLEKNLKGWQ